MEEEIQDINQVLNEPVVATKKRGVMGTVIFVIIVLVLLVVLAGLYLFYTGAI
ncbi:MAG: hypothetical protein ABL930_13190 [Pseudobdellovibrio sp.]